MCKPHPGPRCSAHAEQEYTASVERYRKQPSARNYEKLLMHEYDYFLTSRGLSTQKRFSREQIPTENSYDTAHYEIEAASIKEVWGFETKQVESAIKDGIFNIEPNISNQDLLEEISEKLYPAISFGVTLATDGRINRVITVKSSFDDGWDKELSIKNALETISNTYDNISVILPESELGTLIPSSKIREHFRIYSYPVPRHSGSVKDKNGKVNKRSPKYYDIRLILALKWSTVDFKNN